MEYEEYRQSFFTDPQPEPRHRFTGSFGVALYFGEFGPARDFYTQVLGPAAYVEGDGTLGWRVGSGWLTLLEGGRESPVNVEIVLEVESPADAERLRAAFIDAGGSGPEPSDQLMYRPLRYCPVRDPFGTELLIVAPLPGGDQ